MSAAVNNKELRKLPSIEKILEAPEIQPEIDRYSRNLVTQAAQTVIKEARRQIVEGFILSCKLGGKSTLTFDSYNRKLKKSL